MSGSIKTSRMEILSFTDTQKNIWKYKKTRKGICISLEEATNSQIIVPIEIDGVKVTEIDRKAFLSKKNIKSIIVSPFIEEVGDWSFSHAEMLEKVYLPKRKINFGKKIFLGAIKLEQVCYYDYKVFLEEKEELKGEWGSFDRSWYKDSIEIPYNMGEKETIIAKMMAFACRFLTDESLMNLYLLDESEWFKRWDELLLRFINKDDLEGYIELFASGEEDYEGKEYDIESYPRERRFEKLRMIYFRLMNPINLKSEIEKLLGDYLKRHSKGCDNPEAWDLIVKEYSNDLDAYKCLANAGGITMDNFSACFEDIQDKNAQVKAFLLKWKEENIKKETKNEFDLGW